MAKIQPFHLAIPVDDLEQNRKFYRDVLRCEEGRSSDCWVDFNFFGHQLVIHEVAQDALPKQDHNQVDGHAVPVPHFGVVLSWSEWESLAERLQQRKLEFVIEPYVRFAGEPGEQATMFFHDPSGNALEFKAFKNIEQLFAK